MLIRTVVKHAGVSAIHWMIAICSSVRALMLSRLSNVLKVFELVYVSHGSYAT
jgi:hypothetical protein